MRRTFFLLALGCLLPPAFAQAPAPRGPLVSAVIGGALEYGGDRVADFYFTDGGTQTMRAGQGGTVSVGLEVRPSVTSRVALRPTVGFKYVTTAADNANITLTRIPLALTATVDLTRGVYIGAGVVHHARIRFEGDRFLEDLAFDGATGGVFEAGWRYVGLTYTLLGYTDELGNDYDANTVGVVLHYPIRLTPR